MHPTRLLLPLVLATTVLLLPGPAEATLGLATLGAILAPAALLALPGGPLLLGLGAVGLKFVIASRILSLLCGWLHSRTDRGITLKKEFVHIPARDLAHQPADVPLPVADLAHSPPAFPIQRSPAYWQPVPASPFALPYPYTASQSALHKSFNVPLPPAGVGVAKSSVPSASFFIGRHDVKPSPRAPFPPIVQDNGFAVPSSGFVFTSSVPEAAPAVHHGPEAFKVQKVRPATGGTFDQILRIAQSPAVSTLVSNNPDLIVRFLQGFAGVRSRETPIGTAHSNAGLTVSKIGAGDIEALLNFVRQDPNLVRNIVRADPGFVPSLVNNLIGLQRDGQGSSPPPLAPPPPPPPSFSETASKDGPADGGNRTSSTLSEDNVPANVPIDPQAPKAPHPDQILYSKTPEASPATMNSRPYFASGPSVKGTGFVGVPESTYSFVGLPSTFYTVPNHQPSPFEAYGFPVDIPQPLPAVFSSSPWNVATLLSLFNVSKTEIGRVDVSAPTYENEQNEELNRNVKPQSELPVQRPSQRKWPTGSRYKIPEVPSKDTRPKGSYEVPAVEEPTEETLPSGGYGFPTVKEPEEKELPPRGYGTSRIEEPSKNPPTGGYGIPPVEEPSEDELPTGGYKNPPVIETNENTRPAGSYGVPPANEPIEEEPTKGIRPAGGYGLPSVDLPSEDTLPAAGYGVAPAQPPNQEEQDSGYGSPPIRPAGRPSDKVSSYPTPSDDHTSVDEDVTVVTSPPLGQEIPTPGASSDDIYLEQAGSDGGLKTGGVTSHVHPIEESEAPPAVRPVFVPVTGKFRFDAIRSILGVPRNAGGFPANVYDPLAFWAQRGKDTTSEGSGSGARRRRRRTSDQESSETGAVVEQYLDTARTVDSRKCVFKMICFVGANNTSFGRYGDNVSYLFRYILRNVGSYLGSSDIATDYSRAYETGRTHGGEGCRIKYNTCPMSVVDLVMLSTNFS